MALNRPFMTALAISTLFHLSMVSVFSIMIWFPRRDIEYFNLKLVRQPTASSPNSRAVQRDVLRVPSPDNLFEAAEDEMLNEGAEDRSWSSLPPIELPRLEFAALDRLRTREESLRVRSQFTDLFDSEPSDSW